MRSKSDCHLHKTKPRSVFPANRNKDSSSFFSLPAEDFFSKKLQIFSPEETAKKNLHPDEESVSFFSINGGWGKKSEFKDHNRIIRRQGPLACRTTVLSRAQDTLACPVSSGRRIKRRSEGSPSHVRTTDRFLRGTVSGQSRPQASAPGESNT